jgi:spermidine/putrescine transport system substrate-binding protein
VNYITPVPDAQQVIAGQFDDPSVAHSPLVFPDPAIDLKAKSYRVYRNAGEFDTWNSTFNPIMQGLVGAA